MSNIGYISRMKPPEASQGTHGKHIGNELRTVHLIHVYDPKAAGKLSQPEPGGVDQPEEGRLRSGPKNKTDIMKTGTSALPVIVGTMKR